MNLLTLYILVHLLSFISKKICFYDGLTITVVTVILCLRGLLRIFLVARLFFGFICSEDRLNRPGL